MYYLIPTIPDNFVNFIGKGKNILHIWRNLIKPATAVFDFYTDQDGHPVLLIDSMERARCYICDDNTLVIDGANSAFDTEYSCYSYANGTLTEIEPVESAYQQLDYTPFSQYGA